MFSQTMTPEHRKKISIALTGKKLSSETRARISKNRAGKGVGNKNGLGKNLGNKNAFGKTRGNLNGNWKGHRYGLEYKESLAGRERSEQCEICYCVTPTDFDHDHATGKFRGWLCRKCNLALGLVKDNPIILRRMAHYLDLKSGRMKGNILETLYLE